MAQKRVRAKDLKKQRWATIVAAILALGMLVSLVGVYLGQAARDDSPILPDRAADPQPEDYLAYYEAEVERLEAYLKEHQASPAVLQQLAQNYLYLQFIQQAFFNDQDSLNEYRDRLIVIYQDLIALEPRQPEHRLELIRLYAEEEGDRRLALLEAAKLDELLKDDPNPLVQLSLLNLLENIGEEAMAREGLERLHGYLEQKVSDGKADSEEQLYYAILLGEYLDDPESAGEIMEKILEQENEESWVYQETLNYLGFLKSEGNAVE